MFVTKWNAELLIGIPAIDQQHRQLVELLTEAYVGFVIGINIEKHVVDEVISGMTKCFEYEESWMVNNAYPELFEHKKEHDFFTQRLMEISRSYNQDANTSIDVLIFLNNWVNHHIRLTDAKLGMHQ
jgi:hemerythrin